MICNLLVLLLIACDPTVAQNKTATPFVLDESKPYVFIAFDHAGKRQPITSDESEYGIWLRFVNNCRVPVTISTFGTGTNDPGVGVAHNVVAVPPGVFGGFPDPAGTQLEPGEPPKGYAATSDGGSVMTVYPGKNVLFSVPFEHLSPHWFIRVEFTLEVSKGRGDQPYSYTDFSWDRLPKAVRSLRK